jgi:hypothetical protein
MRKHWDYTVKGYGVPSRGPQTTDQLLCHTTHLGEHSRDMEITAYVSRAAQGDKISRVEVVFHNEPYGVHTIHLTQKHAQGLLRRAGNGTVNWDDVKS